MTENPLLILLDLAERETGQIEWFQYADNPDPISEPLQAITRFRDGIALTALSAQDERLPLTAEEADKLKELLDDQSITEIDEFAETQLAGTMSDGTADLLAVCRTVLHMLDDDYSLLTIILDVRFFSPRAWRLARELVHAGARRQKESGTRVFVLESAKFDLSMHIGFTAEGPVARATRRDAAPGSYPVSDLQHDRESLSRRANDWKARRPLVFLLGAGFAASSRPMPLGNRMRDHLLEVTYPAVAAEDRPEHFVRQVLDGQGPIPKINHDEEELDTANAVETLTLERVWLGVTQSELASTRPTLDWFQEQNAQALGNPGPAVLHVRQLVRSAALEERPLLLLTVNFDTLLEPAWDGLDDGAIHIAQQHRDEDIVSAVTELVQGRKPEPIYVKLHGCITQPESLVTDLGTTLEDDHLGAITDIAALLSDNDMTVIHVGHSLRDLDLRRVFTKREARNVKRRWVGPDVPDQAQLRFMRQMYSRGNEGDIRQHIRSSCTNAVADDYFTALMSMIATTVG